MTDCVWVVVQRGTKDSSVWTRCPFPRPLSVIRWGCAVCACSNDDADQNLCHADQYSIVPLPTEVWLFYFDTSNVLWYVIF